jgi:hypothetical protein
VEKCTFSVGLDHNSSFGIARSLGGFTIVGTPLEVWSGIKIAYG